MLLPKSEWPKFPDDSTTGKPSYCADEKNSAWALEANRDGLNQPMLILCPLSFTKKNIYEGDIPDELDIAPQEPGKVLDAMEPRMLTFYHELFHIVFPPKSKSFRRPQDLNLSLMPHQRAESSSLRILSTGRP